MELYRCFDNKKGGLKRKNRYLRVLLKQREVIFVCENKRISNKNFKINLIDFVFQCCEC